MSMIIAVSMNPSVDKTLNIKEFKPGFLNRIDSVNLAAGGKGINVANDIAALASTSNDKCEVVVSGFMGTLNSDILNKCIDELKSKGVKTDFVEIEDRNRTNIKIIEESGRLTEVNEHGFFVPTEKQNELIEKLMGYSGNDSIFLLMGSVPTGVNKDIYQILTKKLSEAGSKVFVDADGELLKNAVESLPYMIKPNEQELLELFGDKSVSEKQLVLRAKELVAKGIKNVIVSRGKKGALFVNSESVIKCDALNVVHKSSVGAGDAMLAAYAFGELTGLEYLDNIKLSLGASAYAVTKEAPYFDDVGDLNDYITSVVPVQM